MHQARSKKQRPRSLVEVQQLGSCHGDVDSFIREFLDEFYTERDPNVRASMVHDEPPIMENPRQNAYLAAVAEYLSLHYALPIPKWTQEPDRFLKKPFFPSGLESLKAICLVQSPPSFRRRMIFVDANPLSRPRQLTQANEVPSP